MLTSSSMATLRAVLDRIIPQDEFPSACQADVDTYIQALLTAELADQSWLFGLALSKLNEYSVSAYAKQYDLLNIRDQDSTLGRVQAGEFDAEWGFSASGWFRQVCELAAEGYYSDPGNGGNRNHASWHMVGFRAPC